MGRPIRLRRQDVRLLDDDSGLAWLASGRRADFQMHAGRRVPVHVEPVVGDHVRRIDPRRVGRRLHPGHPPVRAERVAFADHLMLAGEDHARSRERTGVHELDVAEVHQVVGAVLVAGLHQHIAVQGAAVGALGQHGEVGDQGRIGRCRVAAPEPDDAVALVQRPGPDRGPGGDPVIKGVAHADTRTVEDQPVVAAGDRVAISPAAAQGCKAMRAAIV